MLAVPLLSNGSVVGILEVFSPSPHAFDERDEEVMVRMGEFAATVICEEKAKPAGLFTFFPFCGQPEPTILTTFRCSVLTFFCLSLLLPRYTHSCWDIFSHRG